MSELGSDVSTLKRKRRDFIIEYENLLRVDAEIGSHFGAQILDEFASI